MKDDMKDGMEDSRSLAIGVDVGGTFTDIFVLDQRTGVIEIGKTPSSLDDQSRNLVRGIGERVPDFSAIASIVHGTTTGTNALLERKGAKTGIITSQGFRDVLEMRRRDRPHTWGLWGQFEPVVSRDCRLEVAERTRADGHIDIRIDADEVRKKGARLRALGCEALCVFFINSYANDCNERAAIAALRDIWPNEYLTRASEILPEIREFERISTATLNAYLQPVVSSYMDRLDAGLKRAGFAADLRIVQSNGGVMTLDTAKTTPVRTALSGPAAGVRAAQAIARAAGEENIITCDLGGTSFDVSLITGGAPNLGAQSEIDFGMVIRMPMIRITTIGAGGGSIARVDAGGLLQIGPESAGAAPGPACYGLGNERPTLTDANLVLGRINAQAPIGGGLRRLDVQAARHAIDRHIAMPLSLDAEQAAQAILEVANAKLAGAIRLVSIERGHDPSKFYAMPFGGGGALHAGALVKACGLKGAIVPRYPGVTSALGCAVADMRYDRVQTVNCLTDDVDPQALAGTMLAIADELTEQLDRTDGTLAGIERLFELDMLYVGQTHTIRVPVDMAPGLSRRHIAAAFETAYRCEFARLLPETPTRIVNIRIAVIGRRPPFDMNVFAPRNGKPAAGCKTATRDIYIDDAWLRVDVFERLSLGVGEGVCGPALLEQPDTTIFIDPGLAGYIDDIGNLIIERSHESCS